MDKKPFLTYEQQIARLIERGMKINDHERALAVLNRVGFYRLGCYWFDMRDLHSKKFYKGATFEDVLAIYEFDKKLRSLLFSAIEDIEIYFRNAVAHHLGQSGAYQYLTPEKFYDPSKHSKWMAKYQIELQKSKESFLKKSKENDLPILEIWAATQIMSFGTLQFLLKMMVGSDQDEIAKVFKIENKILISWLGAINDLRNGTAHFGYLWNRSFKFPPKFPNKGLIPSFDDLLNSLQENQKNRTKLYSMICIIAHMSEVIDKDSVWPASLCQHLAKFPNSPHLKITAMGAPNNWKSHGFWRHLPP
ncbi:MAG: Abi family protein [Candidatus Symbiobacter sp.]|nr:Abi family protein [Candidatus Symbiobacter sp.]